MRYRHLPHLITGLLFLLLSTGSVADPWPCYRDARPGPWLDRSHELISGFVCAQARRIDALFDEVESSEEAYSLLSLSMETQFRHRHEPDYRTRLRINMVLPRTEKRWRLLFEGEETGQLARSEQRVMTTDPQTKQRDFLAALVWTRQLMEKLDVEGRLGMKLTGGDPDPFVQLRHRYRRPLSSHSALVLGESIRWRVSDQWLSTTRADLEWSRGAIELGWRNQAKVGDAFEGLNWTSSLSHHWTIPPRTWLHHYLSVSGNSEQPAQTLQLGIELRRNLLRSWLFYEIEPVLSMPLVNNAEITPLVYLGLEMQFGHDGNGSE